MAKLETYGEKEKTEGFDIIGFLTAKIPIWWILVGAIFIWVVF